MPAKAYIKTFQEAYDEDKMQMMYRFSKAHFVEALTGTVLKKAGVKLSTEWEQSIAKAIRESDLIRSGTCRDFFLYGRAENLAYAIKRRDIKGVLSVHRHAADVGQ